MTDAVQLLDDLRRLLGQLENDLRVRCQEIAETDAALKAEYAEAKRVGRTAEAFEVWREEPLTQAAVAWILGTVFVRFLEDNGLIDPVLSGSGDRRHRALDSHTLYFQDHPTETDREYLRHVFKSVGELPAAGPLFDEGRNPLWRLPISGDAAKTLLEFWQRLDPATGEIAHDLSDANWDTRFLGDLYQDLSETARKRYALLQTPEFVESFILDRTLTPAIETFGVRCCSADRPYLRFGSLPVGGVRALARPAPAARAGGERPRACPADSHSGRGGRSESVRCSDCAFPVAARSVAGLRDPPPGRRAWLPVRAGGRGLAIARTALR